MVIIDTDVVLLAFAFHEDPRQGTNSSFLLVVIWPQIPEEQAGSRFFQDEIYKRPFSRMQTYRMPFVDSLILNLSERTPGVEQFVTWNARHFRGKTSLAMMTPEEYLRV